MNELNEDIDQLFKDVIEPSEMQPSKAVWTNIDKNLDTKQYNKLQKKYGLVFNFSIGISVLVISLVFLILNQNIKKADIDKGNPANVTNPVIGSADKIEKNAEIPTTIQNENNGTSSTNKTAENSNSSLVEKNKNVSQHNSTNNTVTNSENLNTNSSSRNNVTENKTTSASITKNNLEAVNNVSEGAFDSKQTNVVSSVSTASENKDVNSSTENVKTEVVLKSSVDNASEKSEAEIKANSENKTVAENEKQNVTSENITSETTVKAIDNGVTNGSETKTGAEEKNNLPATSTTENNDVTTSVENNLSHNPNPNTISGATETSLTNEPIVKNNEDVLNSASANSTENKTEEVKNNSQNNDTSSVSKASNDTTSSANSTSENNPLNGLIPLKEFEFYAAVFYSPNKVMTTLIDVNTSSNSVKLSNVIGPIFSQTLPAPLKVISG